MDHPITTLESELQREISDLRQWLNANIIDLLTRKRHM